MTLEIVLREGMFYAEVIIMIIITMIDLIVINCTRNPVFKMIVFKLTAVHVFKYSPTLKEHPSHPSQSAVERSLWRDHLAEVLLRWLQTIRDKRVGWLFCNGHNHDDGALCRVIE